MSSRKLFIISGEASGDLHGSNLIKALLAKNPNLEIQGWGGDLMEEAGMKLVKHYKELAFMGFIEVLMNLRTILKNFKLCKAQIEEFQPDAVIFIDYPGFNLRMAEWVKKRNIKSLYYISPQIWAWKQNRVHKIKAYVDEMYTILPFESEFYKTFGVKVNYVGHPLLDVASSESNTERFRQKNQLDERPIIALLPGSRNQEISRMLALMLKAGEAFPSYQLVIAGAPGKDASVYESYISNKVKLVFGQTYDLFKAADAGWITSGTATLEAAIHKLPQAVIYKASPISYKIAKLVIKVKFISLVNLVMDRAVVKELIQGEANTESLMLEMKSLLQDKTYRAKVLSDYDELIEKLGQSGASEKTANLMLKTLESAK